MHFNLFGEKINFEIRGQAAHKSFTGLVLSLGIFATLLAYGTNKFLVFKDYQDTLHQQTIAKSYYKPDQEYSFDEFQISIGVSISGSWMLQEEYSKYMNVSVQQYNKYKQDQKEELNMHSCKQDELSDFNVGISAGPLNNSICIEDRSQMKFIGSQARKSKSKLLIEVYKCKNSTESNSCASQEEITDFF